MKNIVFIALLGATYGCDLNQHKSENREKASKVQDKVATPKPRFAIHQVEADLVSLSFGQAYNRLLGSQSLTELSNCVVGEGEESVFNSKGASIKITMTKVESTSDLIHKMHHDVTAHIGYKNEPLQVKGGGGVAVKNLDELNISYKNSYVLIHGEKAFVPVGLKNAHLRDGLAELLHSNPDNFIKKCGTSYISDVTFGTQIMAVLECRSKNSDEKSRMDAVFNANINSSIFDAEGSISNLLEEVRKNSESGCSMYVEAKGRERASFTSSFDSFAKNAIDYLLEGDREEAVPLYFVSKSYDKIVTSDHAFNLDTLENLDFPVQLELINIIKTKVNAYLNFVQSHKDMLRVETNTTKQVKLRARIKSEIESIELWKAKIASIAESPRHYLDGHDEDWDVSSGFDASMDGSWD